jgi:hypothetical protein
LTNRFGTFTSLRVAIPLVAALVAAIVLPALLLHERDTAIPPFAAPVASESQVVHTQTVPAARNHPATPRHARHTGTTARNSVPVFIPVARSVTRGGVGVAVSVQANAQQQNAATTAEQANATQASAKHGKAKHEKAKHAKAQPTPAIAQPTPAELTPVTAQPAQAKARPEHASRASHEKEQKVHHAATPNRHAHSTALKTQPKEQGEARGHEHGQGHGQGQDQAAQDEDQDEEHGQPHGKGKP